MAAYFGPGGNSDAFRLAGLKSTVDAPAWVKSIGLDAYEYEAGNGLSASPSVLSAIGREAAKRIAQDAMDLSGSAPLRMPTASSHSVTSEPPRTGSMMIS